MEDEDIEEMFAFADKNCDGKLSYSEFEVTMTRDTVSQERLQPMSDGKRHFFAESLLCYSYKLILIGPGIFHRALFEK